MSEKFYVQVIRYKDSEIVQQLGPKSKRQIEKLDDGLTRQMNHAEYYTLIVDESDVKGE